MGLAGALHSVLSNYANFKGRARRAEYWWWTLTLFVIDLVLGLISGWSPRMVWSLDVLVFLGLLLPTLTVTVRRLHDTRRSAWWLLIYLVPLIGCIVMLVFTCEEGTQGMNQYGPWPKLANYLNPKPDGQPVR